MGLLTMKHHAFLSTLTRLTQPLFIRRIQLEPIPVSSTRWQYVKRLRKSLGILLLAISLLAVPAYSNSAQAQSATHQVRYGESLSMIAARYGVSAQALASANGIYNVNLIRVGQVLVIPGAAQPQQPAYRAPAPTNPVYIPAAPVYSGCGGHVVRAGDTLYGVARRYGVDITIIRQYNGLYSDMIRIGQCLVIPNGAPAAPAPDRRRTSEQP